MLLFTGGAGSRKRRLVADDAEVEPEDGPCSVRGFMGPDILSARDRGTGRRGLGRGARFGEDEEVLLAPLLLGSWSLGPVPAASGGRQGDARWGGGAGDLACCTTTDLLCLLPGWALGVLVLCGVRRCRSPPSCCSTRSPVRGHLQATAPPGAQPLATSKRARV